MSQTLRILLLDDNPDDRLLAIRELSRAFTDLEFEQVIDDQGFNKALAAGQFSLAITDYQLRWTDGLTVLRTLKARYPDRPVIMFTNSGSEEVAVEAMKAGLDDYVIKSPRHFVRLNSAVRWVREQAYANQRAIYLETRRKQAESERQRLLEQLEQERSRLEAVLRQMPAGVIIAEAPSGKLLLGNTMVEQIWHQPFLASTNIEQYREWIGFHADGQCYQPQEWPLARSISTGEVVTDEEIDFLRGDGTHGTICVSSAPIRDRSGIIVAAVVTFYDITKRKQLEQSLRQLAEDLAQANCLKDDFLAIVSHELRTPLNAMLGWVQMLRSRKLDEAKTAMALETIERNAKLQTQLIEDLLDISRLIKGKMSLNMRPLDLASVIAGVIHGARPTSEAKGISIEFTFAPDVGLISGDADRLQQIVWNLLANAIKFTPQGGQIIVRLERTNQQAQLQIIDTGIGISADFLPYVFDRFRQAENATTRSNGGLGLGLAIVRQLVEMHGGTVHASSPGVGQGATFTVKLPLVEKSKGAEVQRLLTSPDAMVKSKGAVKNRFGSSGSTSNLN